MVSNEELKDRQDKLEGRQDKTEDALKNFVLVFEKYMSKQDITNQYMKEMLEQNGEFMQKFDDKLETYKKETNEKIKYLEIEIVKTNYQQDKTNLQQDLKIEQDKTIESKEVNQEIKENKKVISNWIQWVVITIISILGLYASFIKK
jgi:arginine utilization protein RocB